METIGNVYPFLKRYILTTKPFTFNFKHESSFIDLLVMKWLILYASCFYSNYQYSIPKNIFKIQKEIVKNEKFGLTSHVTVLLWNQYHVKDTFRCDLMHHDQVANKIVGGWDNIMAVVFHCCLWYCLGYLARFRNIVWEFVKSNSF